MKLPIQGLPIQHGRKRRAHMPALSLEARCCLLARRERRGRRPRPAERWKLQRKSGSFPLRGNLLRGERRSAKDTLVSIFCNSGAKVKLWS